MKKSNELKYNGILLRLYREVHILLKLYNGIFQTLYTPSVIAVAIGELVASVFVCIRLHAVVPMPGFIFYPVLIIDGVSIIIMTKVAGEVFRKSTEFLRTARKKISTSESRRCVYRKRIRSLGAMKIRFGAVNFIDEKTPLVFLDLSVSMVVSFLLLN